MLVTGLAIIVFVNPTLMKMPWFHLKLTFLIGLGLYHYWCWKKTLEINILSKENKSISMANVKLRQANEIATFLLFLVVFTVMLKGLAIEYWWQLIAGFCVLVVVIMLIVKLVNRNKKS